MPRSHLQLVVGALLLHLLISLDGIDCSGQTIVDGDGDYVYSWKEDPTITRSEGEKKQVSNIIYTGDEPNAYTVTQYVNHTFNVKKGAELDLKSSLSVAGLKLGSSIDKSRGEQIALNHKISIDKRSKSRLMFTEKLLTISGRVTRRIKPKPFTCYLGGAFVVSQRNCSLREEKEIDFELTTTELDPSGHAKGTLSVEYIGTTRYRHQDFYNIVNKTTLNTEQDDLRIDEQLNSPYQCAERAILYGFRVALYDAQNMTCYLKYHKEGNGSSFDGHGYKLGDYNYVDRQNLDVASTNNSEESEQWKQEGKCDIIQEFFPSNIEKNSDYETDELEKQQKLKNGSSLNATGSTNSTSTTNTTTLSGIMNIKTMGTVDDASLTNPTTILTKKYLCKSFPVKPRMVLMFQRIFTDPEPGEQQSPKSSRSQLPEMPPNTSSLTSECLNCISFALTTRLRPAKDCTNSTQCGPFSITLDYWKDGGKPGEGWRWCTERRECSMVTVKNYMEKYKRDCNGDGHITCHDYAAIHRRGPTNCASPRLLQEPYWAKFIKCWQMRQA